MLISQLKIKINVIILGILVFVISCNIFDSNSKEVITSFKELNNLVLVNHKLIMMDTSIDSVKLKIPASQKLIDKLSKLHSLREIEVYYIDGIEEDIGIAYKLIRGKNTSYKYLLYSKNVNSQRQFENYEQFVECGRIKTIGNNWTIVDINDCTD